MKIIFRHFLTLPRFLSSICLLGPLLGLTAGCPGDPIVVGSDYVMTLKCGSAEVIQHDVTDIKAILSARVQVDSCDDSTFTWKIDNPDLAEIVEHLTEYDVAGTDKKTCVSIITIVGKSPGEIKIKVTPEVSAQAATSCTVTVKPGSGQLDTSPTQDGGRDMSHDNTTSTCAKPISAEVYQPAGGHVCEPSNILQEDHAEAGLGYILGDQVATMASEEVIACIRVDFGEVKLAKTAQVVLRSANEACGAKCTDPACNTGHAATLLGSTDGTSYTFVQKLFISPDPQRYITEPLMAGLRYLLICRTGVGSARDHVKVDYVELCY